MKKFACVLVVLAALLAEIAAQDVAVFPQVGHTDKINSVAFSPDGKAIVSCSSDTSLKLWDTETGRELKTFNGHLWPVLNAVFSPDGKYILSGSQDTTLKLWDVESGQEIKTFSGHNNTGHIYSVTLAISPDGKFVLSGSDSTFTLWDVETGNEIRTFSGHLGSIKSVSFSPDGRHIISCFDGGFKIWDAGTGEEIRTFPGHNTRSYFATFSPDGKWVLSCSALLIKNISGQNSRRIAGKQDALMYNVGLVFESFEQPILKLWDAATGQELKTFPGHTEFITSAVFSFDGKFILSGSNDKTLKLWDVETGKEIRSFSGHSDSITSVTFSPDGKIILSRSKDNTLKHWDTETGKEIRTSSGFAGFAGPSYAIAYSPDKSRILSNSNDSTLKLWDAKTGIPIRTFSGHKGFIRSVNFSPDGKIILSGSDDKTIKLWDVETGQEIKSFSTSWIRKVGFSPDGKCIIVCFMDRNMGISLLNAETGKEIRTFSGHSGYSLSAVFSPDSKYISGSTIGGIKLWNAETGQEIKSFLGHTGQVMSAVFSPDGKQIVSGSDDGTVRLWDIETGQEIRRFEENLKGYVLSVAFSPDGKQILSDSGNNVLWLWDAETGQAIKSFSGHTSMVFSIVFSSDGKQILSGSFDGTVRLWDVAAGKEIVQFISFTGGEWIAIIPEGYYDASPNGDQYLNVRIGSNVYEINQYRHIFYRPDIVRAALSDDAAAYQAMVKEAGADIKNAVPPPKIAIERIRDRQPIKTPQIELTVTINDENLEIKNVWINVNGRLVAGKSVSRDISMPASGLNVTGKDRKMYFTIPLDVQDGTNVVEVFAVNGYGAEGRDDVSFYADIDQSPPDLWLLAIGVNDYSSPLVRNLSYAVNDAKELVNVFKTQEGKRYGKVNTLVIADGEKQKPTVAAIRESFAWFKQARERDLCILFIAGHAVNDQGGNYYFLPADAAFDGSGVLDPKTAISHREINAVLDMPGDKLFILDTCHSAGAGKAGIADANSFIRQAKEYNPVIFSSSRGSELSLEKEEYGHGLFTYGIINGLEGSAVSPISGTITMMSLNNYVSEIVSKLSNGRQNPTTITPNGYVNFILASPEKK